MLVIVVLSIDDTLVVCIPSILPSMVDPWPLPIKGKLVVGTLGFDVGNVSLKVLFSPVAVRDGTWFANLTMTVA